MRQPYERLQPVSSISRLAYPFGLRRSVGNVQSFIRKPGATRTDQTLHFDFSQSNLHLPHPFLVCPFELASAVLNDIWRLCAAPDLNSYAARTVDLRERFAHIERVLKTGPYFDGRKFSLVDAALGPVSRYFDVFYVTWNCQSSDQPREVRPL